MTTPRRPDQRTVEPIPYPPGSRSGTAVQAAGLALDTTVQQVSNELGVLATSGISLIGSPTLLYNQQIQGATGTPSGWGSTIPNGAPAQYGLSKFDYQGARTAFDALIGFASTSAKIFIGSAPGDLPTTPNGQMTAAVNAGLRIYLGYKPAYNPPTTAEQTAMVASINAMIALCAGAGTGATVAGVFLWNEVNSQSIGSFNGNPVIPPTAAQYATCVNFYGAAINGTGTTFGLGHCCVMGKVNWTTFFSAASFTAGLVKWFGCDYYGTAFNNNVVLDQPGSANNVNTIAAAYTPALAVGIMEAGSTAVTGVVPAPSVITAYIKYMQTYMVNRLLAGLANVDVIWFDGPGTGNCITVGNDFRIPPLRALIQGVTAVPNTGIAAGATVTVTPLNPTPKAGYAITNQLSYDIAMNLQAGAASTRPFATVTLQWFSQDSPSALPVSTQTWVCPMATAGTPPTNITGIGPQHGQFLAITITNNDTVSCTCTFQLNGSGRTVARHDWIWDARAAQLAGTTVPTFTLASTGASFGNSLGSLDSVSVPASGSITILFSMWAGEAYFRCFTNAVAAGKLTYILNPVPGTLWGSSALFNQVPGSAATPANEIFGLMMLPRGACSITVSNSDVAARNANCELVAYD